MSSTAEMAGIPALVNQVQTGEVTVDDLATRYHDGLSGNPFNAVVHFEEMPPTAPSTQPAGDLAIPFAVKGLDHSPEGYPMCEGGIPYLDGLLSERTHPIVQRLLDHGAVIVAITTAPQAGFRETTWLEEHGDSKDIFTKNIFDKGRSAGGSSGGSAVLVAGDYVPLATGSDVGGSLRVPASNNGLPGWKLGPELNDWLGIPPERSLGNLAVDGILARDIRSTAYAYDVLTDGVFGFEDAMESGQPVRLGYVHDGKFFGNGFSRQVRSTADVKAEVLSSNDVPGIEVTPIRQKELGIDFTKLGDAFLTVLNHESYLWLADLEERYNDGGFSREVYEDLIFALRVIGERMDPDEVLAASNYMAEQREVYDQALTSLGVDAVMTPTMRNLPLPHEESLHLGLDRLVARTCTMAGLSRLATRITTSVRWSGAFNEIPVTPVANALKLPAMTLPLAWARAKLTGSGDQILLPVGIHFMPKSGDNAMLAQISGLLEKQSNYRPEGLRIDNS